MQATIYWIARHADPRRTTTPTATDQTAALIIGCVFLFSQFRVVFGEGSRELIKRKGLILNSMFPMAMFPLPRCTAGSSS